MFVMALIPFASVGRYPGIYSKTDPGRNVLRVRVPPSPDDRTRVGRRKLGRNAGSISWRLYLLVAVVADVHVAVVVVIQLSLSAVRAGSETGSLEILHKRPDRLPASVRAVDDYVEGVVGVDQDYLVLPFVRRHQRYLNAVGRDESRRLALTTLE